ncbi:MAG TPA: class I SAM-dependent methyltransferase [Candidatus Limnocylindrales bacterium]
MADSTGTGTELRAGPGPDAGPETARVRAIYDRTAHRYDKSGGGKLPREGRAWLARQVEGATLEVGCGTGRNLEIYPSDIALTGIELSPAMLGVARARAERLGRGADLRLGDGQALPFANESFDTVVFCLSLCSIPDAGRAFAEGVRVLRPGGRIVALEHVRSPHLAVRALERLAEPLTVRFDGDHLLREPLDFARAEGLEIRVLQRFWLGLVERLVAVKPSI